MSWTRYGIVAMIATVMFVTSLFGGHFGYTVRGMPKGGVVDVSGPDWRPFYGFYQKSIPGSLSYTTEYFFTPEEARGNTEIMGYYNEKTCQAVWGEPGSMSFGDALAFLGYALTFQIDNARWLSVLFWVFGLLIGLVILSFIPFIGGD